MNKTLSCGFWKKITVLAIVLVMAFSCSFNTLAATTATGTGIFLGSGNVSYPQGEVDYDVKGYVYYHSNTTAALELSALVQWIYNYGDYEVNEFYFAAHDGAVSNQMHSGGYINPIPAGGNYRIEADWEAVCDSEGESNVYLKNGADQFAYTNIAAGFSSAALGGWSSYWFPTTREDYFHF